MKALLIVSLIVLLLATSVAVAQFRSQMLITGGANAPHFVSASINCGAGCSYTSGAASGTAIGTASATISPGTFGGAWSTSGAAAADFTFSGNQLQTNGATPTCTSTTVLSLNIVATQVGVIGSPYSLPISVTCNPASGTIACDIGPSYTGAIPAGASQAGFTHCAANYDFTQTASFTNNGTTRQWSNLSSWLSCSSSGSQYLWVFIGDITTCSSQDVITTDAAGQQVFAMSYNNSDLSAGKYNNWLATGTIYSTPSTFANQFPVAMYVESTVQTNTVTPCSSGYCIILGMEDPGFRASPTNWCSVGGDFDEISTSGTTNSGLYGWNLQTCSSNSGAYSFGPGNPTLAPQVTPNTYYTFGNLLTVDDVGYISQCNNYASGDVRGLTAGAFLSCVSWNIPFSSAGSPVFFNGMGLYASVGPESTGNSPGVSTWSANLTVDFRRITVWTCPSPTGSPPQCFNNPVITTHP